MNKLSKVNIVRLKLVPKGIKLDQLAFTEYSTIIIVRLNETSYINHSYPISNRMLYRNAITDFRICSKKKSNHLQFTSFT